MNIVLTGFMGTGKSAVGAELARLTGMRLIDLDAEIERHEGMSIAELFKGKGEAAFRDIESAAIMRITAEANNAVLSTGGGAVMRDANFETLRKWGKVVCLMASPQTVYDRTRHSTHRPLLQNDDPMGSITTLMASRRPRYEQADITVRTDSIGPLEVAQEIIRRTLWKH